jgi:Protein of unknown function (DUF2905)
MTYDQLGRALLVLGGVIVVTGIVMLLLGRAGVGRLPGDFTFSTGNVTCIVPLASMILVSIILTIILNVAVRLFNR